MSDREYKYFMMMSERCTGDEEKVQTATLQYPEFDSSEKRAEFNRQRLTIKTKTTSSASGSAVELFDTGIYVGGAKVSANAEWVPYRGFSTISLVEFLEVSGNEREAEAIRKAGTTYGWRGVGSENIDRYSKGEVGAFKFYSFTGLTALGLSISSLFWIDSSEYDSIFLVALALWGITYLGLKSSPIANDNQQRYEAYKQSQTLSEVGYTNIFPITQAVQMADGYNRQLWREMTNR